MNSDATNYSWPKQNFDSWLEQIKKENPNLDVDQLDRKIDDSIAVKAFPFFSNVTTASTIFSESLTNRPWKCGISIHITNPKTDNSFLLHALENGADYVHFDCPSYLNQDQLNILLKDVQIEFITSHWQVQNDESFQFIKNYLKDKSQKATFFISQLHSEQLALSNSRCISLVIYNTESWGKALSQLLASLSKAASQVENIIFTIILGNDFILNISAVRALKLVLVKLELVLQTTLNPYFELTVDPNILGNSIHSNLIRMSSIALSAALTNPDALILPPADQSQEIKNNKWLRSSIHLMQILQHESFLNRTLDPLAGSYCIEDLTEQIARQLWDSIQLNISHDS